MVKNILILIFICLIAILLIFNKDKSKPNFVYMPDMYNSLAYKEYSSCPAFNDSSSALLPVRGTISRGNMPYKYGKSIIEYELAGKNLNNPNKVDNNFIENGKQIYNNYCLLCHGKSGNGQGFLVKKGKYPPSGNFSKELKLLPKGKMYHSIYYGKNFMGSYFMQLSSQEIWMVIEYIKKL